LEQVTSMKPKYSICMCNYNMADTIERSLTSLLIQLDERFEIVLVDDGSTDSSVDIALKLSEYFPCLKVIRLTRDKRRKLGMTRNISIQQARGDYVMLHLDCDDVFGPHIKDFVQIFHRLESCMKKDIMLSGQHINMVKREFLIQQGGYRNIYRGEDRDLWRRMAAIQAYVPLKHVDFVQRLPRNKTKKVSKVLINTFDHLSNDFRASSSFSDFVKDELIEWPRMSLSHKILRVLLLAPACIMNLGKEPIPMALTHDEIEEYRSKMGGSYSEIMLRNGCDPSLSFLHNENAAMIFSS
jgi:glycosyltransferase involved in cell wall biosynthesis